MYAALFRLTHTMDSLGPRSCVCVLLVHELHVAGWLRRHVCQELAAKCSSIGCETRRQ